MNPIAIALTVLAYQQAAVLDVPKDLLKTPPAVNQVLAKVNGIEIKGSDAEALLWEWRKAEVVADLINYTIVKDAAKKQQIEATDQEVRKEVEQLMAAIKQQLPAGQTIEQAMEQEGTAPSRLFVRVKTEVLLRKLILKDFKPEEYAKISTIILKSASSSLADVKVALERAERVYTRLASGEDWGTVLLEHTDDPRARASNGAVGWRPINLFPDSVRTEVGKLKKGGVTKPAQTQNGIQIFKLDALGRQATAEELLELQSSYVAGQRNTFMAKLRSEAKIEKF